jgi:DNA-binding HxlR family transcriptional regulator
MVMGSPIVNRAAPAFYREVDACGVKVALKLLAGKWTPIIFYHLRGGPLRFTEL